MPNRDGTCPQGKGSGTGRGRGIRDEQRARNAEKRGLVKKRTRVQVQEGSDVKLGPVPEESLHISEVQKGSETCHGYLVY
jgi:hypothetical protein